MKRAPSKRSARPAKRRSPSKAAPPDAIEMVMADHKAVDGLFRQFEKLHGGRADGDT